jgi:hypothetical protein
MLLDGVTSVVDGTKRTWQRSSEMSAYRRKADLVLKRRNVRV